MKIDSSIVGKIHDLESLSVFPIVNSDYKIKKYLIENKGLVEPKEISFGNRTEQTVQNLGAEFVPETMQYISIVKTLQKLLYDSEKLKSLPMAKCTSEIVSGEMLQSFSDAAYCKNHELN